MGIEGLLALDRSRDSFVGQVSSELQAGGLFPMC